MRGGIQERRVAPRCGRAPGTGKCSALARTRRRNGDSMTVREYSMAVVRPWWGKRHFRCFSGKTDLQRTALDAPGLEGPSAVGNWPDPAAPGAFWQIVFSPRARRLMRPTRRHREFPCGAHRRAAPEFPRCRGALPPCHCAAESAARARRGRRLPDRKAFLSGAQWKWKR